MTTSHPKAASDIQHMASAKIREIPGELSLVVRHAVSRAAGSFAVPQNDRDEPEHESLYEYVGGRFLEIANDFVKEMTAELIGRFVEHALTALSELDRKIVCDGSDPPPAPVNDGQDNGHAAIKLEPPKSANGGERDGHKSVGNNGARSTAAVCQRRVVRFLERHDFEFVPGQTGELTYRHRLTGGKVWVPKHRRDIPLGTVHSILRQVGEILNAEVRVVNGNLVVVGELSRGSNNGRPALKGGLD